MHYTTTADYHHTVQVTQVSIQISYVYTSTSTYNYHHHTMTTTTKCRLPECKCSICTSGWKKKHHQRKLQRLMHTTMCASGLFVQGADKKYYQRKLKLVTITTCIYKWNVCTVETPQAQGAKVRGSISASRYGVQQQHATTTTIITSQMQIAQHDAAITATCMIAICCYVCMCPLTLD